MVLLREDEPIAASEGEQVQLGKIEKALVGQAKLVSPEGEEIILPASVFRFLRQLIYYLQNGKAVRVIPINKEMTTQEAADLLNVSRPYLVSLLEQGKIPYNMVGTHRRVRFDDLMDYKRERDVKRKDGLAELTQLSQEMGLYDSST